MSAASAAAEAGGPLLLTQTGKLPSEVATELKRLAPKSIVVVGGPKAVSASVARVLTKYAGRVTREAGSDRYATSRDIAAHAFGTASTVFIANGLNFPDALSASAAAGKVHAPVVLVNGTLNSLDSATRAELHALGPSRIIVAGGASAVSVGIATALGKIAPVSRYGGADRYATSERVNNAFFPTARKAYLASGVNFPDALAGAAAAGRDGAPLYIVQQNCVPDAIASALKAKGVVDRVILGGTAALSRNVAKGATCSSIAPKPSPAPSDPKPGEFCSTAEHNLTVGGLTCTYYPHSGTWHWKRR